MERYPCDFEKMLKGEATRTAAAEPSTTAANERGSDEEEGEEEEHEEKEHAALTQR